MSNRDMTYDLLIMDMRTGAEEVFRDTVRNTVIGPLKFKAMALTPPPESYIFTREQIMGLLQICIATGADITMERQL